MDCADVLVGGSTCHIQLERLFCFTGTTEQGTSGAAEIRELLSSANASSSDVLKDWALQEIKFSKSSKTQANPHLMIP
jgi:hypothetical protein